MNRARHIAFIHKEFPYGGAEKVTLETANFLCSQGCIVTILTSKHNKHLYPKGCNRYFNVVLLPQKNIKFSKKVACHVRDFIITNDVLVLVTSRELLYAKWLKAKTGIKIVFQLHSSPFYEFLDIEDKKSHNRWTKMVYGCGLQWLMTQFYLSKYRRVYDWADAYGVLCCAYCQLLINKLHLSADNKLWVLPNSIVPPSSVEHDKQKVIIYIGRLSHRDKRVDRLLHIWHLAHPRMSGWLLKIVGDGREMSNLLKLSSKLRLQAISFEGQTNDVKQYYDEAAILCLTSSFEGWPMSVAEAQSNGVIPVVYNSFLGAKEMISTEDQGVLVNPFDEDAFANALVQLSANAQRMEMMQKQVLEKARDYSINKAGDAWMNMLHHLLEEPITNGK